MKKLIALAVLALGIVASPARAVDIDWTFSGLFSDGTTVNGTFSYEMATDSLVDINLNLVGGSGGGMLPDALLDSCLSCFLDSFNSFVMGPPDWTGQPAIQIASVDLGNAANLNPSLGSNTVVFRCDGLGLGCALKGATSFLVEGELFGVVPAVPLPAGLPLLAGGLAALGFARRFRRG